MTLILNIMTILFGALMVLFILIQARGASLGAGFGGSGELHTERRGIDKTIHRITIVFAIIFVLSIALTVLSGNN